MNKYIMIPQYLFEDILRLLDYLDNSFSSKNGQNMILKYDTAYWELCLKIRRLQSVETYPLIVDNMTEDERHDLHEWVADGNSPYDNPFLLCDDSGRPMDYINACRMALEMFDDTSNLLDEETGDNSYGDWDGYLPF